MIEGIYKSTTPVRPFDLLSSNVGHTFKAPAPDVDVTSVVTTLLEAQLGYLESLRSAIALAKKKDIADVREFGDTMAATLLAGVEDVISYTSLLDIIEHLRDGIAGRRVGMKVAA